MSLFPSMPRFLAIGESLAAPASFVDQVSDDGTLFGNMYPTFLIDFMDLVIYFVIRMGQ